MLKRHQTLVLIVILSLVAIPKSSEAQILTERPGFSSGTDIVTDFQLETGYTYSKNGRDESHTIGELVLRYPLSEHWEVRVGGMSYIEEARTRNDTGLTNPLLELKWRFHISDSQQTSYSIIFGSTVPLGNEDVAADSPEPTIKFNWAHSMKNFLGSDTYGIGGNINLDVLDDDDSHYLQVSPSLYLSRYVSARLNIYIETFSNIAIDSSEPNASYYDGGLWYLLSDSMQVDLTVGSGFNEKRDGWFTSAGFCVAF